MTEEIKKSLDEAFAGLADENQKGLHDSLDIQTKAYMLFQHEAKRLGRNLGRNHPQVKELEKNTKNGLVLIRGLKTGLEASKRQEPDTPQEGAVVYGRVTDTYRRGIAGLRVFGEDETDTPVKAFGSCETDAAGRYTLSLDSKKLKKLKDSTIYLAVAASPDKTLFSAKEPLDLQSGATLLVNVGIERNLVHPTGGTPLRPERETAKVDIEQLKGIGDVLAKKLREAGISDVQTFAATDNAKLKEILGRVNIDKLKKEAADLLKKIEDHQ